MMHILIVALFLLTFGRASPTPQSSSSELGMLDGDGDHRFDDDKRDVMLNGDDFDVNDRAFVANDTISITALDIPEINSHDFCEIWVVHRGSTNYVSLWLTGYK